MRLLPLVLLCACQPSWEPVVAGLDGALLSVWGEGEELWAVGADAGEGPHVLRRDGTTWEHVDTGTTGDLWWVWGEGSTRFMVGDGGRVLTHDAGSGETEETVLEEGVTLFGVWGAQSERWAVGGDLAQGEGGARLWHSDGGAWEAVALPAGAADAQALYKVWGTGADDVWVVGTGGVTLHRDAQGWSLVPSPVPRTLFTVHGAGQERYAVGGVGSGTLLRAEGEGWADDSPAVVPQMNGVYVRAGCDPVAVGRQGAIYVRTGEGWVADERKDPPLLDLHAVHVDEGCGVWAVGGALASPPLTDGILVHAEGS